MLDQQFTEENLELTFFLQSFLFKNLPTLQRNNYHEVDILL